MLAEAASRAFGQTVITENRPGRQHPRPGGGRAGQAGWLPGVADDPRRRCACPSCSAWPTTRGATSPPSSTSPATPSACWCGPKAPGAAGRSWWRMPGQPGQASLGQYRRQRHAAPDDDRPGRARIVHVPFAASAIRRCSAAISRRRPAVRLQPAGRRRQAAAVDSRTRNRVDAGRRCRPWSSLAMPAWSSPRPMGWSGRRPAAGHHRSAA